eukprot:9402812-Pyramimonas_sp.AAC.1
MKPAVDWKAAGFVRDRGRPHTYYVRADDRQDTAKVGGRILPKAHLRATMSLWPAKRQLCPLKDPYSPGSRPAHGNKAREVKARKLAHRWMSY